MLFFPDNSLVNSSTVQNNIFFSKKQHTHIFYENSSINFEYRPNLSLEQNVFLEKVFNSIFPVNAPTIIDVHPELFLDLPPLPLKHRRVIERYLSVINPRKEDLCDFFSLLSSAVEEDLHGHNLLRDLLRSIKIIDLERIKELNQFSTSSYLLRSLCVKYSKGTLSSCEAFHLCLDKDLFNSPLSPSKYEILSNYNLYIYERQKAIRDMLSQLAVEAVLLSNQLEFAPRLYIVSGNYGAGKTYFIKNHSPFHQEKEPFLKGILSFDAGKAVLKQKTLHVSNQQIHREACIFEGKLFDALISQSPESSFILDTCVDELDDLTQIIDLINHKDMTVSYRDTDCSLMISCLRILSRDLSEACMPFETILSNNKALRQKRQKIISFALESSKITEYELYDTMDTGKNYKIAYKGKDNALIILDQNKFKKLCKDLSETEIRDVKNRLITPHFLATLNILGVQAERLVKYQGKTIEEALKIHSKTMSLHSRVAFLEDLSEDFLEIKSL